MAAVPRDGAAAQHPPHPAFPPLPCASQGHNYRVVVISADQRASLVLCITGQQQILDIGSEYEGVSGSSVGLSALFRVCCWPWPLDHLWDWSQSSSTLILSWGSMRSSYSRSRGVGDGAEHTVVGATSWGWFPQILCWSIKRCKITSLLHPEKLSTGKKYRKNIAFGSTN